MTKRGPGRNVGAKLPAEQAQTNKLIALVEVRARVVEAEAQVPIGMEAAFRSGNLGSRG
jgi:uncharacterized protein YqfA (UPF0365 family)